MRYKFASLQFANKPFCYLSFSSGRTPKDKWQIPGWLLFVNKPARHPGLPLYKKCSPNVERHVTGYGMYTFKRTVHIKEKKIMALKFREGQACSLDGQEREGILLPPPEPYQAIYACQHWVGNFLRGGGQVFSLPLLQCTMFSWKGLIPTSGSPPAKKQKLKK